MLGETIEVERFIVGATYSRFEIAVAGQVAPPTGPRDPHWGTGIVRFDNAVLLLVTLEKEEYGYLDYFDGSLFWWQSQNQQTQGSPVLAQLAAGVIGAYLFVRIRGKTRNQTEPFVYCGPLSMPDFEGARPVTALFGLLDFRPDASGPLADVYRWTPGAASSSDELRHKAIAERQARGQGRQQDSKLRRALELYAMKAAVDRYEEDGWLVEDTSSRRPYDLLCKKGTHIRRVEVKGTQSAGQEVLVTAGEVNAAREKVTSTDLFILHSVAAKKDGDAYVLSGGAVKLVEDWAPEDEHLSATAYSYRIPAI